MDFDSALKLARTYFTGYIEDFAATARGAGTGPPAERKLDSRLWTFVVLSIAIGVTLAGMTGLGHEEPLLVAMVFLLTNWCAFSLWAYLFCRFVLRGSATFMSTLSILLYVLPAVFVVSHFVAMLGRILAPPLAQLSTSVEPAYVPALVYLIVQALLLAVYLPLNLRSTNGFGPIRTAALVMFVPIPLLIVNTSILYGLLFVATFDGSIGTK